MSHPVFPWQQGLWQQLCGLENIPHALLLSGREGSGKQAFLENYARYLLCQQPKAGQPCGHCRACQLIEAQAHPDLYRLSPAEVGKPITVDAVRAAIHWISQSAQMSGRKVLLVMPAESMNINAANSLLKTLEEPPADSHILLASHYPDRLLPTIRSRSQQYQMPASEGSPELYQWLTEQYGEPVDESQLSSLLKLAEGAPLKVLSLLAQQDVADKALQALQANDWQSDISELIKLPLPELIYWFQAYIEEIGRLIHAVAPLWATGERLSQLQQLARGLNKEALMSYAKELGDTQRLLQTQANTQLILENLLIQWQTCR